MSNLHHRFFTHYMMHLDGRLLSSVQRAEMQAHLSTCPECHANQQLYQGLRAEADQRWTVLTPLIPLERVLPVAQRRARKNQMVQPLRAFIWVGFAVLMLVLVQWIFSSLRPIPAFTSAGDPTPISVTPEATLAPQVFDSPASELYAGERLEFEGRETPDHFGASVDIDGDVLAAGAPRYGLGVGDGAGVAYVFRRSAEGEWQAEAALLASDRDDGFQLDQHFGESIAVSGTVIAVGAPGYDDPQAGDNTGAVYIFEYDGHTWMETGKLTSSYPAQEGKIGRTIALDGDYLAVSGSPQAESVILFERWAEGWREIAQVPVPSSPEDDPFYVLMDLYGDTLALSTIQRQPMDESADVTVLRKTGLVTLFERAGDQWNQTFQTAPQEVSLFMMRDDTPYGIPVSLGGGSGKADWLAVGKPGFTESGRERGSVLIFERNKQDWTPQAELMLAPGEPVPGALPFFGHDPGAVFFGAFVEIEGNRLAVIASFANTIYVFERQGEQWVYQQRITPGVDVGDDFMRRTVAMSGNSLLLGSPGEIGGGVVLVFDLSP